MHQVQQSAHVMVMSDIPGQDALSEHCGWYNQVGGGLPQDAEPGSAPLIERGEALDPAGVEYDDQPAALWT
jgi:hypothetical protein